MPSNSRPSGSKEATAQTPFDRALTASPDSCSALRRALLDHYDEHARPLPWRAETDPYRILVSEVMLQQTRVDTVLGFYGRWMERFPDLDSLARADLDDVLEAWEGLGYYRRARHLHRAAKVVRDGPGGRLPSTYAELRALPGVGEYTAGAVASIAFGEVVPAPDGNVRRVLARLFDEPDPKPGWVRERATELVDPERPGDWNQALMELGATICTPRAPECGRCPATAWCGARRAGTQMERPEPRARRSPRNAVLVSIVLVRGRSVLLLRRPEQGLLGGMWAFPEIEVDRAEDALESAPRLAEQLVGFRAGPARPLPTCEHRFTHIRATYLPYVVEVEEGSVEGSQRRSDDGTEHRWVDLDAPVELALPVAQRRILESARYRLENGGE